MRFQYFRFFLSKLPQMSIFGEEKPIDILFKILDGGHKYAKRGIDYAYFPDYHVDHYIVASVGKKKSLNISKPEEDRFVEKPIEHWPHINVIFNLDTKDPVNGQLIAVESNVSIFQSETAVMYALESFLNEKFGENISVSIKPLTKEVEFWKAVEKHDGKLKSLDFSFHAPNFFGKSAAINDEIKAATETLNAEVVDLSVKNKSGKLKIPKDSKFIKDSLEYVSRGGGEYTLKADKVLIKSTQKGKRSVTKQFEGLQIKGEKKEIEEICKMIFHHDNLE